MATVHIPKSDELPKEKREPVERLAKRKGVAADELSLSYRAKVHRPEY